jgi:hypothetical protein
MLLGAALCLVRYGCRLIQLCDEPLLPLPACVLCRGAHSCLRNCLRGILLALKSPPPVFLGMPRIFVGSRHGLAF